MKRYTIIWDFDGTILQPKPYDSEQFLLLYKLHQSRESIPFYMQALARAIIYADMKERFRRTFKKLYLFLLIGTHTEMLDHVSEFLAKKISEADRQALVRLKENGHNMLVVSCGTVDLSERVLRVAGVDNCFSMIKGNRFQIENDKIIGMDFHIQNPEDKLKLMKTQHIRPENSIVIGDGYTDRPLLSWAGIPVLIDRKGKKSARYAKKGYHVVSSLPEIVEMIEKRLL
jgi:HAD superfamily phosphoserine phosphatase-like hydrolase